jgi:hypothetical protein
VTDDGGSGGAPASMAQVHARRRKASTTVYLPEEQLDALKTLSARVNRPMAELIREGVDLALEKHAPDSGVKSDT